MARGESFHLSLLPPVGRKLHVVTSAAVLVSASIPGHTEMLDDLAALGL